MFRQSAFETHAREDLPLSRKRSIGYVHTPPLINQLLELRPDRGIPVWRIGSAHVKNNSPRLPPENRILSFRPTPDAGS